ncbi:ferrous iron transport protein A [bacterium]|jgi:Fe2+ transport system protein FeoA|nr:ferrous iron transport protein A [bacterium]
MLRLNSAVNGYYRIVRIGLECPEAKRRLTTLGIFVGDIIEVTKSSPGPVIFKKGETSIGIGQGIAMCVSVIPLKLSRGRLI